MNWFKSFIYITTFCGLANADQICRNRASLNPHINGLWIEGFPENNMRNLAMCEGEISISNDGELCIDGRVNYAQMIEFVKENYSELHNVYQPAAASISVTGHLASGTGNAVFGSSAKFLYDFVTSYVVDGTTYTSNTTMIDNLLTASRGTIDGVCFDSSFVQEEAFYAISQKGWAPSNIDIDEFADAEIFYGSKTWVAAEYHTLLDAAPNFISKFISNARYSTFELISSFPTPSFVFSLVPIFQFTGLLRTIILGSVELSTSVAPQPLQSPDLPVENTQLDISWTNFLLLVENGIYSTMPDNLGTIIKRISADANSNGCWKEAVASIDFQVPEGFSKDLDDYISGVFYTKLLEVDSNAELTFHMGKRVPVNTPMLQAAMDKFASCGASVNVDPEKCYHPMCKRTNAPSNFEYPEKYFDLKS